MNLFQKMWCKLFDCAKFVAHQMKLFGDGEGSPLEPDPQSPSMWADIRKLKTDMAAIVPIIAGIAAQFPLTVDMGTLAEEIEALGMPDMSVWFECAEVAKNGDVVELDIWAKFTAGAEVTAVGIGNPGAGLAGITFDPTHFTFLEGQETRGEDIVAWGTFDVFQNNPGELTFGAIPGSARGIIGDKPVHLARIKLQVATTNLVEAIIQMDNYVDSLEDCLPKPATAEIMLNEN